MAFNLNASSSKDSQRLSNQQRVQLSLGQPITRRAGIGARASGMQIEVCAAHFSISTLN